MGIDNPVTRYANYLFICYLIIVVFEITSLLVCVLEVMVKYFSHFRETHGSGNRYHQELAKQLASFLKDLLEVCFKFIY